MSEKEAMPALDVLHVTEACGGGVRRHLRLIIPALQASGLRCGLFAFGHRDEPDFADDLAAFSALGCEVRFRHHAGPGLREYWGSWRALRSLLAARRPRVLHLHAGLAGVLGRCGHRPYRELRIAYSPHAFAFHPSLPKLRNCAVRAGERLLACNTDGYIFVGRSEIADANRLSLPPERFHLVENGLPDDYCDTLLDATSARRELGIALDALAIGVPCRLVRQKGLDVFLDAFAQIAAQHPKAQVFFCGEGPEREPLQRQAERLGLSRQLRFLGMVPDLSRKLTAFDLALLPSFYEGLSYVLLECLGAAVPLLVSDILANIPRPEFRECLDTFRVGEVGDLALRLDYCLQHMEEMRGKAQLGAELIRSEFMLSTQVDKLILLYKRLGRKSSGRSEEHTPLASDKP
jgi:glycosyltransferase involved in cell wall biosynthesis